MAELVATALWNIGGAIATDAAVFLAANATAVNAVALAAAGSVQSSRQRRKALAAYNAGLEDRLVMTSTVSGARSRCYGRVANVDGVLFKATRGTDKEFYTLFIACAGHEIDGFEGVRFGDQLVTLDGSGYVQDAPYSRTNQVSRQQQITLNGSGGGVVTAGGAITSGSAAAVQAGTGDGDTALVAVVSGLDITVSGGTAGGTAMVSWQEAVSSSKARVRFYTGAPGQDLSAVLAPLFPTLITAGQHRFAGIAGLLVDLEFDPDAFTSGVPSIVPVFRGAKVYDPRSGLTQWAENPALIARDWAMYAHGGGCAAGDLAASSVVAAANACDVSQAFTTPSGTVNLPLYTCGMVCRTDEDPWEQMQEIVESMAGKAGWAGGQLRLAAGVYRAPVATLTEDWLSGRGDIQVVPEPPVEEAVNVYRPTIADKDQGYVPVPAPEVRSAVYISADGRELSREMALGGVTDATHAQHVCGVLMRDARNGLTAMVPCNLRAFQVELFDVVAVTLPRFGWTAKTFEVLNWGFSLAGGVNLTLKETAAAIFQPDALFSELDLTPNSALPDPSSVPTLGPLSVSSGAADLLDGSAVARVRLQWPAPNDRAVSGSGWVEIQYAPAAGVLPAGDWTSAPLVPGSAIEAVVPGFRLGFGYVLRARFVNALGVRGSWCTQVQHIVGGVPAAPEVYVSTPSAGVTVTGVRHTPNGINPAWATLVASVTFTPKASGTAAVFFEGRGTYTAGAVQGEGQWSIQDPAGAFDGWKTLESPLVPATSTRIFQLGSTRSFEVLGGVAYTLGCYVNKFNAGDTFAVDNMEMRVQVTRQAG